MRLRKAGQYQLYGGNQSGQISQMVITTLCKRKNKCYLDYGLKLLTFFHICIANDICDGLLNFKCF